MDLSRRSFLHGALAVTAAAPIAFLPAVPLPPGEYTVVLDSLSQFTKYAYERRNAAKALMHAKNYGMGHYNFKRALETPAISMNLRVIDTEDAYRRFVGSRVWIDRR